MSKLILVLLLFLGACSNPKSVLICGDHICVNKKEAQQYFEENLTIEVKIIDPKKNDSFDLVELNLKNNSQIKKININKKNKTDKKLKDLSNIEVKKIKENIRVKEKQKKSTKIKEEKKKKLKEKKLSSSQEALNDSGYIKKISQNENDNIIDVCTIIKKCSIDEISKYLIKQGKNKDFPDITKRE